MNRETSAAILILAGAIVAGFAVPIYTSGSAAPAVIVVAIGALLVFQGIRSVRNLGNGRSEGPVSRP